MIATATALLECRPVRGRSLVVALGVALDAGIMSLMLLSSGQTAQTAAAQAVQVSRSNAASDVRATAKGDRLVLPARLEAGRDGWGNGLPVRVLRTA